MKEVSLGNSGITVEAARTIGKRESPGAHVTD